MFLYNDTKMTSNWQTAQWKTPAYTMILNDKELPSDNLL